MTSSSNKLSDRYKNDYLASANAEKSLRAAFEEQKQRAYELNYGAAQYAILKHEVESSRSLYETLQRKLKEAGISAGLASANIGLVDAAQVPSEPVEPRVPVVLGLGLGAGLMLGTLGAVVLEATDTTIRSGEEAEELCAVPSLATIPRMGHESGLGLHWPHVVENEHEWSVVTQQQPYSMAAESYRTLRSSLLLGRRQGKGFGRHQRAAVRGKNADGRQLRDGAGTTRREGTCWWTRTCAALPCTGRFGFAENLGSAMC